MTAGRRSSRSKEWDELSAIITELIKTNEGKHLVCDAFAQGLDPKWEEKYDKDIREFPDPNRRRA